MRHLSANLPDTHSIVLTSDWHIGLKASNAEVYEDALSRLRDKNCFAILGGDLVEGRNSGHDYYEVAASDADKPLPVKQALYVRKILEPHRKKIITGLSGNHERDIIRRNGNIYETIIYDPLGIPYGTYSAKVVVKNQQGKLLYRIFYTHGYGSISTSADDPIRQESNMKLSLKRKLKEKFGDCAVMCLGHTHKLLVAEPTKTLYLNGDEKAKQKYMHHPQTSSYIHPDYRWYCNTGSALKTFEEGIDTYSEVGGYNPVELGYCILHVVRGEIKTIEKVVI